MFLFFHVSKLKVFVWFPERKIWWNPSPPARWPCGCSLTPSNSLHLPTLPLCSLSNVTPLETQGRGPRGGTGTQTHIWPCEDFCFIIDLFNPKPLLTESVPDSPGSILHGGVLPFHSDEQFTGACSQWENICTAHVLQERSLSVAIKKKKIRNVWYLITVISVPTVSRADVNCV